MKKCNLFLKYIYAFLLVMSSIKVTCRYFVFVNVNLCECCVCVLVGLCMGVGLGICPCMTKPNNNILIVFTWLCM